MNSSGSGAGRRGFTLLEILVALVLIGLLAGALVPSVVSQLSRGEANRVVEDAGVVGAAAKAFRVDVGRYPGDLDDLTVAVTSADLDVNGTAYPNGLLQQWAGPYLEQGGLRSDSTVATGMGGSIVNEFSTVSWGGRDFLTVKVAGISEADAERVSAALDGEEDLTLGSDNAGRVRWKASGTTAPDTLVYLATPVD